MVVHQQELAGLGTTVLCSDEIAHKVALPETA